MYKVRGCIAPDDSAKKTGLLHGCNLALLSLLLSTSLSTSATAIQQPVEGPVRRIEILSYEGEKVSSVELAGQPGMNADDFINACTSFSSNL